MKALTLTQPWATLVVTGRKRFETRSWWYRLPHEGPPDLMSRAQLEERYFVTENGDGSLTVAIRPIPLAIHAAKGQDRDAREFADYLFRQGTLPTADLPRGAVIGEVLYHGAHWLPSIVHDDGEAYAAALEELGADAAEQELGDWSPGRYAWELSDPVEYDEPFSAPGSLGIWNWPKGLEFARRAGAIA